MFSSESHIRRCPLGHSSQRLQTCGFGETLFHGMEKAPSTKFALARVGTKIRISFEEFLSRSELIARHLLRLGCRKGDVLVIFAPNSIEWLLVMSACFRIGVVAAGVNVLENPDEFNDRLHLCGAKWIFTASDRHLETTLAAIRGSSVCAVICDGIDEESGICFIFPQCVAFDSFSNHPLDLPSLPEFDDLHISPKDVAMIAFSSGTTGRSKAIPLSHLNLQSQFIIASDKSVCKVTNNQVIFAPFGHLGGGLMTMYGLALGHTTNLMTNFDIELYLRTIAECKNESISIVPSVALAMVKLTEETWKRFDLSSLKDILCGTAPLVRKLQELLSNRLPQVKIRQGYGLTETTAACTTVPRLLESGLIRTKSGSVGVPLFNVEIKVVDKESGDSLGPNEQGELMIRSPLVMKSYNKEVKEGRRSEVIDEDGWLHTGDVGYYDDDGWFFIVDRISDMISCGHIQVSPSELESVLLSHPRVSDAAVFALNKSTSGNELPAAWVVRKIGQKVTEEELKTFVSDNVAPHKLLAGGVVFVESIPRSSNGKILRNKIREHVSSNAFLIMK